MADLVLVQPRVGDWDDFRSHPSIPLALLSLSSFLVDNYSVKLIDQRTDPDWEATLARELKKDPLAVGTTSYTSRQILHAMQVSRSVKENSNAKMVWGGIHASLLPGQTLDSRYIDSVVIGEGEESFRELVDAYSKGRALEAVRGVGYKTEGNAIRINPPRQFLDLNKSPPLPYKLVNLHRYLPVFRGRRTMYLETSRGCPNRCAFCYNHAFNRSTWRSLTAENAYKRLADLYTDYKISSFYIIDDNYFVNLKRAEAISNLMISNKMDVIWESQGITINSAKCMSDDYLRLLERSGLRKLHFGVESGSERILKLVDKNLTISDVLDVNKRLRKFDIVTQYNFMAGFPTETKADMQATIDLCFRLMKDNHHAIPSAICTYSPYPGTKLFDMAVNAGFKVPTSLEGWANLEYGQVPWVSKRKMANLKAMYFVSHFLDKGRGQEMFESSLIRLAINLYGPIAKYRLRHQFYKLMPELALKELLFPDRVPDDQYSKAARHA
jgi:anaerobic magnesium-protoporphyrin IX monomethyl ester cyclase